MTITTQDIEKLASEYAEFTDMSPVDKNYIRLIVENYTKWLSKTHCIINKDEIREDYSFWHNHLPKGFRFAEKVANDPDTARMFGKIEILIDVFGKEMFDNKTTEK